MGNWRNLVSGILGEMCHSQFRTIFVDINPYPANLENMVSSHNASKWQMGFNLTFEGLNELKQWIWRVWPNRKMNQVLLQHDNTRLHTGLPTKEATATLGWSVLPHPPYTRDFATYDCHLFGGCTPRTPFCGWRRT